MRLVRNVWRGWRQVHAARAGGVVGASILRVAEQPVEGRELRCAGGRGVGVQGG